MASRTIFAGMHDTIIILDFGSQYTQLIARRVRELNVYCEIHPYHAIPDVGDHVKGVILSGSPYSVYDPNAPKFDLAALRGKVPLLGVCFGAQYMAFEDETSDVRRSDKREYGRAILNHVDSSSALFTDVQAGSQVWMSHGDTIHKVPKGARVTASTKEVEVAAFEYENEKTYGIQFHPEVFHSTDGPRILKNFVVGICGASPDWTPHKFVESSVAELRDRLGEDRVILGLSGGVDSSVAAMLLNEAIGDNLYCIFVDNGLLRKNEYAAVLHGYRDMGLNVRGVDAKDRFYAALSGITDPEQV